MIYSIESNTHKSTNTLLSMSMLLPWMPLQTTESAKWPLVHHWDRARQTHFPESHRPVECWSPMPHPPLLHSSAP